MMTESGFVRGQGENLPKIDAFMMTSYFASNPDFTSAEVRGVKAARSQRETYGDSAVGCVQVKRDGDVCIVKARITPEHNVRQKCYAVTATCNESEETILSVQCDDCAAHLGGCKHAIAFLAWLHRRSEDPPTASVECKRKKSKLSAVGTSLKFMKAKDICNVPIHKYVSKSTVVDYSSSFLTIVKEHCKMVGDMNSQLMKYYKVPSNIEKLSIHYLVSTMPAKPTIYNDFIEHCKLMIGTGSCEQAAQATIGQNSCPLWHELRYARITASKAYEASHCNVLNGTLMESILGASILKDTEAMKRERRLLKDEILKEVEKKVKIKINKCGLILSANYPVMGASPDGESDDYIIEIKCPSAVKTMSQYISPKNKLSLKCMAQVQLQMHFSHKTKALFCVAHSNFEKSKDVKIILVEYDKELCETLLEKCNMFWEKAIFPILFK